MRNGSVRFEPLSAVLTAACATLLTQPGWADAQQPGAPAPVYGGALDADCSHVGVDPASHGYQFIVSCPGKAMSADGRMAVSMNAQGGVKLVSAQGDPLDEIPNLSDAMPLVLFWSPGSDWFFANHYLGSGLDRLRVFQVVNRQVIERSSVFASAVREMVARYPCLSRHATVVASGWQWSRDGRRIAMIVYARPDACWDFDGTAQHSRPGWEPLWMIGDVESGQIDPASIRVRANGVGPMPADGPYATL